MDDTRRGWWLVAARAACEIGVLSPGPRLYRVHAATTASGAGLIAGGAALTLSGALALGRDLRLQPAPFPSAVLRTGGPYRLVRHPMYVGMVAAAAGLALVRARAASLVACAAMVGVLSSRATLEERMLLRRFGEDYLKYQIGVVRGLPGRSPRNREP